MLTPEVIRTFAECATSLDEGDLVRGALCLPYIEYRDVDSASVIRQLTRLGAIATARLERLGPGAAPEAQIDVLNTLLFEEEGFRGNATQYEDPRNSFLDDVMRRRTGLPIALSVIYLDVARRSGVPMEGINFPGHFLVRYGGSGHRRQHGVPLVVDPFHGGTLLDERALRLLYERHAGEGATFDRRVLAPASRRQILARMAMNLKRLYVAMRSFPQALAATDLLLALDPLSLTDLRDRGLLAYHTQDLRGAVRDLQAYLQAVTRSGDRDEDRREELQHIWEHVKALRRRLASLN